MRKIGRRTVLGWGLGAAGAAAAGRIAPAGPPEIRDSGPCL